MKLNRLLLTLAIKKFIHNDKQTYNKVDIAKKNIYDIAKNRWPFSNWTFSTNAFFKLYLYLWSVFYYYLRVRIYLELWWQLICDSWWEMSESENYFGTRHTISSSGNQTKTREKQQTKQYLRFHPPAHHHYHYLIKEHHHDQSQSSKPKLRSFSGNKYFFTNIKFVKELYFLFRSGHNPIQL